MSYSAPYLDENGIHVPSYEDRMEKLIADYKSIFGEDAYLEPDSMDYQLLSIFAKQLDDMTSIIIDVYNARNPNYATGVSLDTLLSLNGLMRYSATRSSCILTLTGEPNMTIDAGAQALDTSGYIWEIEEAVTFDNTGIATATALCTTYGAISAGICTITEINTPVPNWYGVTNTAEAVMGRNLETDAEARRRRANSLAIPATSTVEAIRSALVGLEGVTSVNLVHNDTSSTDANGLPAHSFCAVVQGGNSNEIAKTIWEKKAPGVASHGAISKHYVDIYGNDNVVKYSEPTDKAVSIDIEIIKFTDYDASLRTTVIPRVVSEYVNSLEIGENLIVSRLYAAIYEAIATSGIPFSVKTIEASAEGESATSNIVEADFDEIIICDATDVTVVESE